MLRISRHCAAYEAAKGIPLSAESGDGLRPFDSRQGLCPMEPATFEKVDETFKLSYFFGKLS